jgi:cytochrome c oxidase subunit 2
MLRVRSAGRRLLAALTGAGLGAALIATPPAHAAEPWVFAPSSDSAQLITQLFWLTLVLAVTVFVLVEALLIYSSLRFRRRSPVPTVEPPQIHGNTRLEVLWAIVPAIILIGLFGASVGTLNAVGTIPPDAMHIEAEGQQFQWRFTYPSAGVTTTNDLRLPVGRPVVFDVTSADVVHSFWVPDLHGKIDAIPGHTNHLTLTAQQAGTFRGVCAELCGQGHASMLFTAQAMAQADFDKWVQDQKSGTTGSAAGAPSGANLDAGKQVFASKPCVSCHTLAAVPGATGKVGPDLDGVGTRAATRKSGMTAEAYIRESIQKPDAFIVPGFSNVMPPVPLTDDELASLVALLLAQK